MQELQAERAVEALVRLLPATALALRKGVPAETPAEDLVPGDVIVVSEGDRISADARLIDGAVSVDLSALNGEPVTRSGAATPAQTSLGVPGDVRRGLAHDRE